MFCAYLQISSSTCNFVNLNRLCSLSRNFQLLSCNFSITLLVLFLTLTVLKGPTTLITQQSLLIKPLYTISPLTTIRRCFIHISRNRAIQISPSNFSSVLSVYRLFVLQFVTTYLSDCGRGIFLDLHRMFWGSSPPVPQFMASLLNFSTHTLLYLIKPAAIESPITTIDVLLFEFRSATCLLCFSSHPFL